MSRASRIRTQWDSRSWVEAWNGIRIEAPGDVREGITEALAYKDGQSSWMLPWIRLRSLRTFRSTR